MFYNVTQFLREPVGSLRVCRVDEGFAIDSGTSERVKGLIHLMRTDMGIWARAILELKVDSTCSRCLKSFRQPLTLSIDEECLPSVAVNTDQLVAAAEAEDEALAIDQNNILDLRDVIRQSLIVNRSMKPLCQSQCRGMCPICGSDRDLSPCQCEEETRDPRWAQLAGLLPKSRE